jgi:predicted nucleotidyltransferase
MLAMDAIEKLSDRIVQEFHPERIILFGSYASGSPQEHSDVDILVVMPCEGRTSRLTAQIISRIRPEFPIDLLVRSPDVLKERIALNDFFLRDIVEHGRVLYAAADR